LLAKLHNNTPCGDKGLVGATLRGDEEPLLRCRLSDTFEYSDQCRSAAPATPFEWWLKRHAPEKT